MEVDTPVMIITIALSTPKNVTVHLWTYFCPPPVCMSVCVCTHMCTHMYKALLWQIASGNSDCSNGSLLCVLLAPKGGPCSLPLNRWRGARDHSTRDAMGLSRPGHGYGFNGVLTKDGDILPWPVWFSG